MRMEGMLDSDCPVIVARDRDSGRTEKIPARTFAYDFLLNYHRCAGAFAEITAREGAGWERKALREAVRAGSPGPEKLAWHASRTLGAVRLFLDGVRRFGPFDSMGAQNFYCLERPCAGRGKEKEREYAGASAA